MDARISVPFEVRAPQKTRTVLVVTARRSSTEIFWLSLQHKFLSKHSGKVLLALTKRDSADNLRP